MDSISTEKLQSTKNYKKFQFLSTMFLHSVLALICALLCSYTFWFPFLCSSINSFFFVSLPNFNKSFFFNSKFLFIVGNAIIIFLIGESKLSNSPSSPDTEIYGEYVRKSPEFSSQMEKKGDGKLGMKLLTEDSVKMIEKEAEEREEEEEEEEEEESGLETEEREEEEEESGLETEDREQEEEESGLETEEKEDEEEESGLETEEREEEEEESGLETEEREDEEEESGLETEEREEEEEESGLETEELNKRVEDFIARVKRQRLAEARFEDCGR